MIGEDLNTYYDDERGLPYSGPVVVLDESGLVYLKGWMKNTSEMAYGPIITERQGQNT